MVLDVIQLGVKQPFDLHFEWLQFNARWYCVGWECRVMWGCYFTLFSKSAGPRWMKNQFDGVYRYILEASQIFGSQCRCRVVWKHEASICIFHIQEHQTGSILRVIMSYFNRDLIVAAKCLYCLIAHSSYQQGQFSFLASYWWNSATGMEQLRTRTGLYTFCKLNTLMDSMSGCLSTIQSAWKSKINLLKFKAPWSHLRPRPLSCIPLSRQIVKNVCDSAKLTMSVSVWWLGSSSTHPQV